MKRLFAVFLLIFLLSGCGHDTAPIDSAINLRESLLTANGTAFHAAITADYGDALYQFELDCNEDQEGNVSFAVTYPESITGITGVISSQRSALTFEDKVLAFPPLSDGQLSPVIAPYLLMRSLRSGYISACGREGDGYCIYIDDTYFENQLKVQVFTDEDMIPIRAEMIYRNQRILTLDIYEFSFL